MKKLNKDEKPLLNMFSFDKIMKGIVKVRPPPQKNKKKEIRNKKQKKKGKD